MPQPTSNRPFLKVLLLVLGIIAGFWIASKFSDLVLTVIISGLAAFILKPVVNFLELRLGIRRVFCIALVFLVGGGLVVFGAITGVPILVDRVRGMYESFKTFPFDEKLADAAKGATSRIPFVSATTIVQKVHLLIEGAVGLLGESLATAAGFVVNLAIVPFITYFILAEGDTAVKKIIRRIPNKYFEMTLNVADKIGKSMVSYLRGWILESTIVGVLSIIGFTIIGIDYPVLIGVLAGIANLVPYLGPIVGAGLAVIVSLTQTGSFQMLGSIVILSVIIRVLDDVVIQPLCFGKSLEMHPVFVVFTLIIGHELMGVAGMVVAIPIATILRVSATETYWGLKHYSITA